MSVDSSALHAAVSLACSDPRARPSAGRVRPQSVRADSDSRRRANKSLTVGRRLWRWRAAGAASRGLSTRGAWRGAPGGRSARSTGRSAGSGRASPRCACGSGG